MAQIRIGITDLQFIDQGDSITRTGNNTFTVSGTYASSYHIGRRVKCFDSTTLYGTITDASTSTNTGVTIRLDNGNLTNSLSSVAIAAIGELNRSMPDSVYRIRNGIDNGDIEVWQRGTATYTVPSGSGSGTRCGPDRWRIAHSSDANIIGSLDTAVPTVAQAGRKINNSLNCFVISADAAIAVGQYAYISQSIEGSSWRQYAQKPLFASFWVNSGTTGTYCLALQNTNGDRSYVTEFNISQTGAFERKTFQLPPSPSAGTWDYSSGVGLRFTIALAAGSSFQGGAGNWTAANIFATSNQVNFLGSNNSVFRITGIELHDGSGDIPSENRSYREELDNCRRYLNLINGNVYGYAFATNGAIVNYTATNPMRVPPSLSALVSVTTMSLASGSNFAISVSAVIVNSTWDAGADFIVRPVGTPLTVGQGAKVFHSSSASNVFLLLKSEI